MMNAKLMIIAMVSTITLAVAALPQGALAVDDINGGAIKVATVKIHKGVGTVKKIKKRSGKIRLDHGPIKSIGWMGMVMTFDVENKKLLKGVKVGDKVSFGFYATDDGRHVITEIKRLK
ncbi:hypothetical protein MNBD_NITROSPINAE03-694 [hydrothermal vent metagenome]|uniref:Copper-binding protein n=1 Tax=hydrothermal vent metagenome TaxID=652676 RepID=A0A3B1BJH8_9ZZZZ